MIMQVQDWMVYRSKIKKTEISIILLCSIEGLLEMRIQSLRLSAFFRSFLLFSTESQCTEVSQGKTIPRQAFQGMNWDETSFHIYLYHRHSKCVD